jgi:hypothetical protein
MQIKFVLQMPLIGRCAAIYATSKTEKMCGGESTAGKKEVWPISPTMRLKNSFFSILAGFTLGIAPRAHSRNP